MRYNTKVRKMNEIFGYAFYAVGILKTVLVFLVLMKLGTNISAVFSGGNVDSNYYPMFALIIGFAELILGFCSVIMIIVNTKKQPEVVPGYLYGLGGLLIQFLIPPIMSVFAVFAECGLYIKAGSKIKGKVYGAETINKVSKEMIDNTEWFYSENSQSKNNKKQERIEIQKQKKKAKLEKELAEWKELLDSGEVDEDTYNQEITWINEILKKI